MFLKIILRGMIADSSHNRSIRPDMQSDPVALSGFILRISLRISAPFITKESNLLSVMKEKVGSMRSFKIGLHWLEKKVLKILALSQQSKTKAPFSRRGGIFGT